MTSANPPRQSAPDATWTVNDVLRHHPDMGRVLNAFGIDTCCGGMNSLAEAAREADVPLDDVLSAVAAASEEVR